MKRSKKRINTILSLILTLMLIVPVGIFTSSLRAEEMKPWVAASYEDMPDLDEDLVNKYLSTKFDQGASLKGDFVVDMLVEASDDEMNFSAPIRINGEVEGTVNSKQNLSFKMKFLMNAMGEQEEMELEGYLVDDPENPEQLLGYAKRLEDAPDESGEPAYAYSFETVPRADIAEVMKLTEMQVDREVFDKVVSMKLKEDKGDTVDAVAVVNMEEAFKFSQENLEDIEDSVPAGDLDEMVESFEAMKEQLGLDQFVLPFTVTLEKETGHPIAMSFDGKPFEELMNRILSVFMSLDESSPDMKLTINEFSFNIPSIVNGVDEDIAVPEEFLVPAKELLLPEPSEPTADVTENADPEVTDAATVSGGYDFTEPLLYDDDNYDLVDKEAAMALFSDLGVDISFTELDKEDENPTILVSYKNTTAYPIRDFTVVGKSKESNEEISYYFMNSVLLPGETSAYLVTPGYSDYQRIASPEDFIPAELRATFVDAPEHTTSITYDVKLNQISSSYSSDYTKYTSEPLLNPDDFTVELGMDDNDNPVYVVHNNSDKPITSFYAIYKTENNYEFRIYDTDTLLPEENSSQSYASTDDPAPVLDTLKPLSIEVTFNVDGEEEVVIYHYGLEMYEKSE